MNANLKSQKSKQSRPVCPVRKFGMARLSYMVDMFHAILRDIHNNNPVYRSVDLARDLETIKIRLREEGLGFITVSLPLLMSDLFLHSEGGDPSYLGWKKQSKTKYPAFLGRLFREVYHNGHTGALSFSHIYQICVLFKKLKGPFKKSVLAKDFARFVEDDVQLGRLDFTAQTIAPILDKARKLIETIFADVEFNPGDLLPKPGPGATNTPVAHNVRFRPHTLFTDLDEEFNYLEYFYTHSWDPHQDAKRYMNLVTTEFATSRYKAVHKYLGKPRGICIEENEMQFFQQALKRYLYKHLESCPATRGRINFTSQSVNRNLALESSGSGEMATVDMTSASNLVARELVFRLFMNTPLIDMLDKLSTRVITHESGEFYAHMFAPMGSGICFPIMSVVHWALVRAIIQLTAHEDSRDHAKRVYVYGDDIIVPVETIEAIYTYMPLFGMKLNANKSFYRGPFRESCGIHAYYGVDVTPVYVNHIPSLSQDRKDITTLLSLIAKEHAFFANGMLETAQFVRKLVERKFGMSLPEVGEASPVLGWKRPGRSDFNHVAKWSRKMRYNQDFQTLELNLLVAVPVGDEPVAFDDADGYLRNLVTKAGSVSTYRKMPIGATKPELIYPNGIDDIIIRRSWVNETNV